MNRITGIKADVLSLSSQHSVGSCPNSLPELSGLPRIDSPVSCLNYRKTHEIDKIISRYNIRRVSSLGSVKYDPLPPIGSKATRYRREDSEEFPSSASDDLREADSVQRKLTRSITFNVMPAGVSPLKEADPSQEKSRHVPEETVPVRVYVENLLFREFCEVRPSSGDSLVTHRASPIDLLGESLHRNDSIQLIIETFGIGLMTLNEVTTPRSIIDVVEALEHAGRKFKVLDPPSDDQMDLCLSEITEKNILHLQLEILELDNKTIN